MAPLAMAAAQKWAQQGENKQLVQKIKEWLPNYAEDNEEVIEQATIDNENFN